MKKNLLAIAFLFSVFQMCSQSIPQQRCDNFRKGLNLNNWLEAYWSIPLNPDPNRFTRNDIIKMKEAGITSLRLPICFAMLTDTAYPYFVDTTNITFRLVDSVIQWAEDYDMKLIIDNHHAWNFTNENWRSLKDPFVHMWSFVSSRYSGLDPDRYFFELLNEPPFGLLRDSLNEVFNIAIDSIRKHTPAYSIIVSPHAGSAGGAFNIYQPLSDTNLIYTFHSYDPFQFTHQGFTWVSPYQPTGITFPTGIYDQMLYNSWDAVINWVNTYHKPVFLGEFACGTYGDEPSRCNWIEYFGRKIDSTNISWFYWDWDGGFNMFNSGFVSEDSIYPCFKRALHLYGDTVTLIQNISKEKLLVKLFPNPVSSTDDCNLEVESNEKVFTEAFDAVGRKIFESRFFTNCQLPVSFWNAGIYFISVRAGNKTERKKLVLR